MDNETREVLCSILGMLRSQAVYLHRQHGWMIAIAETVDNDSALAAHLRQHPFYNQGPRQDVDITNSILANIDALTQRLRE